jgi:hypothetical protein
LEIRKESEWEIRESRRGKKSQKLQTIVEEKGRKKETFRNKILT